MHAKTLFILFHPTLRCNINKKTIILYYVVKNDDVTEWCKSNIINFTNVNNLKKFMYLGQSLKFVT